MERGATLYDRLNAAVMASVMGAAVVTAPQAKAQDAVPTQRTVAVGILDIGADRIDFPDANVRFVNMNPRPPEGRHFADGSENKTQHGVVVASAFVREYRKLDPEARIVFYAVNPFTRKAGETSDRFDSSSVREALPRMKEAGVKVVMSAFGVADKRAGEAISGWFRQNGLVLVAAMPNVRDDPGIYPAALDSTISVADSNRNAGLWKDTSYKRYVDFTMDGEFASRHTDSHGSSFTSGKVAAYGAYVAQAMVNVDVDGLRGAMRHFAKPYQMGDRRLHAVGGDEMIEALKSSNGRPPEDAVLDKVALRGAGPAARSAQAAALVMADRSR